MVCLSVAHCCCLVLSHEAPRSSLRATRGSTTIACFCGNKHDFWMSCYVNLPSSMSLLRSTSVHTESNPLDIASHSRPQFLAVSPFPSQFPAASACNTNNRYQRLASFPRPSSTLACRLFALTNTTDASNGSHSMLTKFSLLVTSCLEDSLSCVVPPSL